MKTLKLIIIATLILLFDYVNAQTYYGTGVGMNGGNSNSYFGYFSGTNNNGLNNTFIGSETGLGCKIGENNTFLGSGAGYNSNSDGNTFLGAMAGGSNESGSNNTYIGAFAGQLSSSSSKNVFIGYAAGAFAASVGSKNIFIGESAGLTSQGSNNIIIGNLAGISENGHHKLIIAQGSKKLISGDFATKELIFDAKVGIGTTTPQYKLDVCGRARAIEVNVEASWCDYVFADDFDMPSLNEEEAFIKEKGHLLSFRSEAEMNGEIQLGDVTKRQQETIEKLMLHVIELNKKMEALEAKMNRAK